jgi:DNA-binding LytR/AlgR family response regulator
VKTYTCLIADDERNALDILENYIGKLDHLNLKARCSDAFQVYSVLRTESIDLAFLDISMPQLSGMDLFRSLALPPKVIFTTAHKDYAIEAFELRALDYLLKPFSFERFLQAVDRLGAAENEIERPKGHLTIYHNRKHVRVELESIQYIQAIGNYAKLFTTNKMYVTHEGIKSLLSKLPHPQFVQIHKSFIVALSKIDAYTSDHVLMGVLKIPVGRTFKQRLEGVRK